MAEQYPERDNEANSLPHARHPAGLIAGREQDIGRVGDRHGDREALAMRVVHHARPAVGVLVKAQRGGVTGKGHGSRRPWRRRLGPGTRLSGRLARRPVPDHRSPLAQCLTLPADIGGGEQRDPDQSTGHQPDPTARHQAQHDHTDCRPRTETAGRGQPEQQSPGRALTESHRCGSFTRLGGRRHGCTPFARLIARKRTPRCHPPVGGFPLGGAVDDGGVDDGVLGATPDDTSAMRAGPFVDRRLGGAGHANHGPSGTDRPGRGRPSGARDAGGGGHALRPSPG